LQLTGTRQRFDGRSPNEHRPICMWLFIYFLLYITLSIANKGLEY